MDHPPMQKLRVSVSFVMLNTTATSLASLNLVINAPLASSVVKVTTDLDHMQLYLMEIHLVNAQ